MLYFNDDVIEWKHFPRYWPFVQGIHRSPVNFPHKGQWRGALMFSLICTRTNDWVNNRDTGDLRRYRAHNDVIVMLRQQIVGDLSTVQGALLFCWCLVWANSLILMVYFVVNGHSHHCPSVNEATVVNIYIYIYDMHPMHNPLNIWADYINTRQHNKSECIFRGIYNDFRCKLSMLFISV